MSREWREGYQAGYCVTDFTYCPYNPGTTEYKDWNLGYEEGRIDYRNGR